MASGSWTTGLQMDIKFSCAVLKSINYKFKKSGCKGICSCLKRRLPCTDYCQFVHELCANRPSHEVVGSGSGYDTENDESDVDSIPNNLKGEGM